MNQITATMHQGFHNRTEDEIKFMKNYRTSYISECNVVLSYTTTIPTMAVPSQPSTKNETHGIEIRMQTEDFNEMSKIIDEYKIDLALRNKHPNLQKVYDDYVLLRELLK
jgi:hypothetical protein